MPIEFACSACNKPLRVADEVAGKVAKCPHCSAQMQVPATGSSSAPTPTQNPFAGPATVTREETKPGGTITLRRIDVASTALMLGALYALVGLVAGLVLTVFAVVGAVVDGGAVAASIGGGLIMGILFPVANGVGGLIGGALMALLYNFVAKFVGGIKFEI